jgi:hypothetical protein
LLEPRQHVALQEAPKSLGVGGGGFLALVQSVGATGERVRPPGPRILAQRLQRGLVSVVAPSAEQLKTGLRDSARLNLALHHAGLNQHVIDASERCL